METALTGFGLFAAIAALFWIGIWAVRFGCRRCAGFDPSKKDAAIAIGWVVLGSIPISIITSMPGIASNRMTMLVLVIINFAISAYVLGAKLKHPDEGSVGFKKGGLISLIWSGVGLGTIAASTVVIAGIVMIYGAMSSPSKQHDSQPAPQTSDAVPNRQAAPQSVEGEQQQLLSGAAREIIARFPQLDPGSPMADQSAIDYVVGRRDAYAANGHAIDIALRMAANDYAEQLHSQQQQETDQQYAKQISSHQFTNTVSSGRQSQTWSEQREARSNGCQPKAVMTDEEIARCRGR